MGHPLQSKQVKFGLMDDAHIKVANAGNGQFIVTTGLLEKANDDRLQAVLAHETAHEDLGHVAKAQALGTGLHIGMVILDQILPGSGALTPIDRKSTRPDSSHDQISYGGLCFEKSNR